MNDVVTSIIAVTGGVGGVVGVFIAIRAEARATRAVRSSEKAQKAVEASEAREYWSNTINAAQKLVGANVAYQDMHPLLVELRTSITELIDAPMNSKYGRLAPWLHTEHKMINGLFAQAQKMLQQSHPITVDALDAAHRPVNKWLEGFIGNLRAARKSCGSEMDDNEFRHLEEHNQTTYEELKRANPGLIPPAPAP